MGVQDSIQAVSILSGDVVSESLTCGDLSADSLSTSGELKAASVTCSGDLAASSIKALKQVEAEQLLVKGKDMYELVEEQQSLITELATKLKAQEAQLEEQQAKIVALQEQASAATEIKKRLAALEAALTGA